MCCVIPACSNINIFFSCTAPLGAFFIAVPPIFIELNAGEFGCFVIAITYSPVGLQKSARAVSILDEYLLKIAAAY